MRNVTISLEDEVALWARVEAARRGLSLSRFVSQLLRQRMQEEDAYSRAMEDYLGRDPGYRSQGGPYPRREELHDRPGLR
ncbi:MAG TPA: CopG family transcriptional regulator [Candidatus Nitrosotenuis sp.]|jgi:hypothetical protein|nr:CopG family transcriptional regulator [Candidatus Nitrosotenuis sp.]